MKVVFPGHKYELTMRTPDGREVNAPVYHPLRFVGSEPGTGWDGVTTQEVLRALIDRTWYCDTCLPSHLNDYIVYHLRMALVLHEARALIRKTERGELNPEVITLGRDGHFDKTAGSNRLSSYAQEPRNRTTDTGGPNPGTVNHCAAKLHKGD